jgi:hypothetical protein
MNMGMESAVLAQMKRAQGETNQRLDQLLAELRELNRRLGEPGRRRRTDST